MTDNIYAPTPRRPPKRKLLELDETTPSSKRRQTERPILDWLSHIQAVPLHRHCRLRARSAPPAFDTAMSREHLKKHSMSQQAGDLPTFVRPPTPAPSLTPSVVSASAQTNDSNYPQILYGNGVVMDRSGRRIPPDIKAFVKEHIIDKQRASPPLAQAELDKTVSLAEVVADSSEGAVHRLLDTAMFSVVRDGLSASGNVPFSSEALPTNLDTYFKLATPKPDRFYGYTTAQHGDFTRAQNNVMSHPHMTKYAQPTSDSAFPFLIIEVKSEAEGGTIWHAENQAAGSGSHCVNSMRWLMQHAKAEAEGQSKAAEIEIKPTKTIAFSICLTARQIIFYVHSYSAKEQEHLMSHISSFLPTKATDIQECRNYIKNIIDFALDVRKQDIKQSLDELHPIPTSWPQKRAKQRAHSSATSTPATSFSGLETRKDD